jgi:hypothetical protein
MRARFEAYARDAGRLGEVRCLDLSDPAHSDSYNPFLGGDPLLVAERAHASLYSGDHTSTPFYRESARSLFLAVFPLCRRLNVLPTPAQLRLLAQDQNALAALAALDPEAPESAELKRGLLRLSNAEYSRTLQGLANALAPLSAGPIGALVNTCRPSIDTQALLQNGGLLYAGLASDQYPALFRTVSTLLLMDLQASLTVRYRREAKSLFVYLDEFADLLYPEMGALVAKAREARVGIIAAHQSLGDLERAGGPAARSLFENFSNKILLRVGSAESADRLAALSAEDVEAAPNPRISRGGLRGGAPSQALRLADAPGIPAKELLNLSVGEAYLIVQRRRGRELYRARLPPAPEPKSWDGPARIPTPGPARPALVWEEGDASAAAAAHPEPEHPLGAAAFKRLDRRRNRADGA